MISRAFNALPAHIQAAAKRHPKYVAPATDKAHVYEYAGVRFKSKTEANYARHCDTLQVQWRYEPITLKLADGVRYTPDFVVFVNGETWIVEVKGFWRDDARVKFRVAREQFAWLGRWFAVQQDRLRDGGGFSVVA